MVIAWVCQSEDVGVRLMESMAEYMIPAMAPRTKSTLKPAPASHRSRFIWEARGATELALELFQLCWALPVTIVLPACDPKIWNRTMVHSRSKPLATIPSGRRKMKYTCTKPKGPTMRERRQSEACRCSLDQVIYPHQREGE